MRSVGVDLHKDMFCVCYLSDTGSEYRRFAMVELERFKSSLLSTDRVAVEATGNTRYFVGAISPLVSAVTVVNPKQFRVISDSVHKTDRGDAELLALFLSKDLLPEIKLRDEFSNQIKSICQTRDRLVKLRTSLINKIHNLLHGYGIVSKRKRINTGKGLEQVLLYSVPELSRLELEVIVSQISHLNDGISRLDQQIATQGQQLKGFNNITSIKGIAAKSGAILLSVIGDIDNFASEKKLQAYFGIVPTVHQSNKTQRSGRITKAGSKLGRTTLVQCTLIAIRYSPYLNAFYQRLKLKKGSGKAIIATAKKLLGIIYLTLKNDWVYEDFPNFVIAK
jgi:transposase